MAQENDDRVSRRRYQRAIAARTEAEGLLEGKSRELFLANKQLSAHSARLEKAVQERTCELQLALERAEAAGKEKSRFIATMSHEIRTPLGGLLGMIDLLSMDETDPQKKELLGFAKTAGSGLSRIVNDVLDFSKMEAGVFVFQEEHVDVRALVESVQMLAKTNEKSAERVIISEIDDTVPQMFLGDATRVRQVISNLVNNALRYSRSGPIYVRGHALPHPKGVFLRVEVEDTGVGIAPEGIQNLFKDFSQVANPLTAAAQGTGLGLAICKRILEGLGGEVGVKSTLGVGSTFWFELPVAVVEMSGEPTFKNEATIEPVRNILDGKRVLIAEDNIINQRLLSTYAERMNLQYEMAENGRIALEKFDPEKFDLVLMDVAMPEVDGLEATRRIRMKWAGFDMPPILALTAHVMDAIEEEATIVGIDTVLSKPIPFDELKQALELALTHRENAPSQNNAPEEASLDNSNDVAGGRENSSVISLMVPDVASEMLNVFSEEELVDLVGKYVTDCAERLETMKRAIAEDDQDALKGEGHSVKGSSMVLGFPDISEWSRQIEQGSSDGSRPSEIVERIEAKLAEIGSQL